MNAVKICGALVQLAAKKTDTNVVKDLWCCGALVQLAAKRQMIMW